MAVTLPNATNPNLQATTRAMFVKGIVPQILMKRPLMAKLYLKKKVTWNGGIIITRPVDKVEIGAEMQSYFAGEPMGGSTKEMLDTPYFTWKYAQVPCAYDVETMVQNIHGGPDTQLENLATFLVKKAHSDTEIGLYKQVMGLVTPTGGSGSTDYDNSRQFNSAYGALKVDATYAHVTRTLSTAVNQWFQGGSINGYASDVQNTAATPSISLIRQMIASAMTYGGNPSSMIICMGRANYLTLKAEVDSHHLDTGDGQLRKYGFDTFTIDGVEVVLDYFLDSTRFSGASNWVFLFNTDDWELRMHPTRNFVFTGFTWQGDRVNAPDQWFGRVMIAGNLCCWKPNGSVLLTNVS